MPLLGYLNGTTLEPITGTIENAYIVFQEGQDAGPDNFVNGMIVGQH